MGGRTAVYEAIKAVLLPPNEIEEESEEDEYKEGFNFEVIEEESFLFRIKVCLENEDIFDLAKFESLIKVINSAKNARSHLRGVDFVINDRESDFVIQEGIKCTIEVNQELETLGTSENTIMSYMLFKI